MRQADIIFGIYRLDNALLLVVLAGLLGGALCYITTHGTGKPKRGEWLKITFRNRIFP